MWELLTVLAIYTICSFTAMAFLWTRAAKKGVLRVPKFFFWVRERQAPVLMNASDSLRSNALSYNCSFVFAAASAILITSISTSDAAALYNFGSPNRNQSACVNPLAIG